MTAPKPVPVRLPELRQALREAVDGSSLRQVAADVGMSFNGVRAFIAGGSRRPQAATVRKVTAWYERTRGPAVERRILLVLDHLSDDEYRRLPPRLQQLVRERRAT